MTRTLTALVGIILSGSQFGFAAQPDAKHPSLPLLLSIENRIESYQDFEAAPRPASESAQLFSNLTQILASIAPIQTEFHLWQDSNQPIDFARSFGPIPMIGGNALEEVPDRFLESHLPSRYRLAEALGLGTNTVRATVQMIDPDLFTKPLYGFQIRGKVRHNILGEFHCEHPRSTIQTFHWQIDSQSHFGHYDVDMGPGVKPHKFRLEGGDLIKSYGGALGYNRGWEREKLGKQLPFRGIPVGLSLSETNQFTQSVQALDQAIEKKLTLLRSQVVEAQLQKLTATNFFNVWETARHKLVQREQQGHNSEANCLLELFAQRVPTRADLEAAIRDQHEMPVDIELLTTQVDQSLALVTAHQFYHQLDTERKTRWLQQLIQELTAHGGSHVD